MWTWRGRAAATSASWVMSTIVPPRAVERAEDAHDLGAGVAVEVAGRLVGQDERRARDQRPGDRDALLLAAGELGRLVVEPVAEPDPLERGARRARARSRRETPWYSSGVATFSSAVVRGSRLYDWKMKPMVRLRIGPGRRRRARRRLPDEARTRPRSADPGSR